MCKGQCVYPVASYILPAIGSSVANRYFSAASFSIVFPKSSNSHVCSLLPRLQPQFFFTQTEKARGWGGVESGNKAMVSLVQFPTASANFSVRFPN